MRPGSGRGDITAKRMISELVLSSLNAQRFVNPGTLDGLAEPVGSAPLQGTDPTRLEGGRDPVGLRRFTANPLC